MAKQPQQSLHNIGLLMVTEGLLSREALERALVRKRREGGSLALNLVLEGAVDEVALAQFYARRLNLQPAGEDLLHGVSPATFALLPIEIVYDNGVLPLFLQDDDKLVVGMVDPTDETVLSEARFFAGFELVPRLITVSQMARHFARLSGQPWRIDARDAEALAGRGGRVARRSSGVDELLQQTTVLDKHYEELVAASMKEARSAPTVQMKSPLEEAPPRRPAAEPPGGMSLWVSGSVAQGLETIRLEPLTEDVDTGPIVVTERDLDQAVISTTRMPALAVDEPPAEHPFLEVRLAPEKAVEFGLARPKPPSGAEPAVEVVEGEAVTASGSLKVLGFRFDSSAEGDEADSPGEPVARMPKVRSTGFERRPKSKVPARPPAGGEPEAWIRQHFALLTRLGETMGEPDPEVAAAIEAVDGAFESVRKRDDVGELVVSGLAPYYDTVALFTLNGPRAVIWRCRIGGQPTPEATGQTVEIERGGILHRISEERVFYWGPLPESSGLRKMLAIAHEGPVLVAPIELRGKTVLILCLDPGAGPFRSPGNQVVQLILSAARALERAILLRRRRR